MTKTEEYISLVDFYLSKLVDIGGINNEGKKFALDSFAKTPESDMESYSNDIIEEVERIIGTSKLKAAALDTIAESMIVHAVVQNAADYQNEVKSQDQLNQQQQKLYNIANNRSDQYGKVLELKDLINPNPGTQNQPQARTSFAQSASLANEAKETSSVEANYPNLPPLNSTITVPPIQKVPFPTQIPSNNNYPNTGFQPNNIPLPQPAQNPYPNQQQTPNSGQYPSQTQTMPIYPVNNIAPTQSYPQQPISAPRPVWRPGSNLVKPPTNSN